jgi:Sec-independent protein translocase protein TatA
MAARHAATTGRLLVATTLLYLSPVHSFVARGHGALQLQARRDSAASSHPAAAKTRHGDAQMFGPPGGSFLNLGTPEMIVIGACAWALLGPKELYRLSAEAGKFLGEWQQLGLQAKNTFTDALETEMREDEEAKKRSRAAEPPAPSTSDFSEVPTLTELEEQRRRQELEDAPPLSGLSDEFDFGAIGDELGPNVPTQAEAPNKFAQQLSGDVNRQVMAEFPAELATGDAISEQELGFEAEEISLEEEMLDTRIAEAENMLKMLATEQKVLELRREQQAANAARAAARRQAALAENIDGRSPGQTPADEGVAAGKQPGEK